MGMERRRAGSKTFIGWELKPVFSLLSAHPSRAPVMVGAGGPGPRDVRWVPWGSCGAITATQQAAVAASVSRGSRMEN